MSSLEIGMVIKSFPPTNTGGESSSCKLIVERLKRRGHDVKVLSFDREPQGREDLEYVQRHTIESNRIDISNVKARNKLKEFSKDKDIIHCYGPRYMPATATLRETKTIATLNNYKFFYPFSVQGINQEAKFPPYRLAFDSISRKLIQRIDKFTATSTDVKRIYEKYLPAEKIEVVPEMFDPDFPKFHGLETNENEILYVGAIEGKKGVKNLVKHMQYLKKHKLTVVGSGSQEAQIKRIKHDREIQNVEMKGYLDREELLKCYERAGWFIHPGSWAEPFGRTIIEAMQMKTPVIATDKGGPRDILPKNQLIDHISEIEEKLHDLNRKRIISSQEISLNRYSPSKVSQRYEDLYMNLS